MCVCVYVCEFYDFSGGNSVPIRRDVKDSLFPQGEKTSKWLVVMKSNILE